MSNRPLDPQWSGSRSHWVRIDRDEVCSSEGRPRGVGGEARNDSTNQTGVGISCLAVMQPLKLELPRRLALLPLLVTGCYMPLAHQMVPAGLHLSPLLAGHYYRGHLLPLPRSGSEALSDPRAGT